MHIHDWMYDNHSKRWTCDCGETITKREFEREYSRHGNLDVDPIAGLNRMASQRRGPADIKDFDK